MINLPKEKKIVPPLSKGYMASSILGFLVSAIYVFPNSKPWGLAFSITFAIMFASAIKSMTFADPDMYVALETGKKVSKPKNPFEKKEKKTKKETSS